MERDFKIHLTLISSIEYWEKKLLINRLFFYSLVLSISVLLMPMAVSAYSGEVYFSSFQNIDYTINLTGEIYYNFGSPGSSQTLYSYCVDKSVPLYIPGSYHAESSGIASDIGLLKAAWLIDNFAASKPYTYDGRTSLDTGVALQLAIWDQLSPPQGLDRTDPTYAGYQYLFDMRNYFDNQVNGVTVGDLSSLASKYQVLRLYTLDAQGTPSQVVESLTPVPIPAAFMLFGSGLLGLLGLRRKITLPAI
ncbi:MAG TPA: hypothetical protein VMU10_03675 [Desulfomonilia bacterium]|nr:hypothetical protein [Desulfomonilia bacterium]